MSFDATPLAESRTRFCSVAFLSEAVAAMILYVGQMVSIKTNLIRPMARGKPGQPQRADKHQE
jgi:hypothetical protein